LQSCATNGGGVFNFIKATALSRKIAIEKDTEKIKKYFSDLRSIVSNEFRGTRSRRAYRLLGRSDRNKRHRGPVGQL